ncbi:MAG: phosphoribosylpyrophosphate synthetase [Bacteroidota bacterium]
MKRQYDSLLDAVNDLKKRGFTYDFTEQKDKLYCSEKQCDFNPNEFKIVEFYRFEGISDPEDNSIVYAISSDKNKIKGVLINAYGVYSDTKVSELISKMEIADASYQ